MNEGLYKNARNKAGLTEAEFLAQYKPGNYERPSVTVDMLLFTVEKKLNHLKVLLIKRGNHPYINCWALPGGFVGMNESTYEAAGRELYEETGLRDIFLEQLYTYSRPERDPRMRVISVAYMALIPITEAVAGDDARDAAWFDIRVSGTQMELRNEERGVEICYSLTKKNFLNGRIEYDNYVPELLTEEQLAFDHELILLDAVLRLRNKVEYTDIAFNLVGEEFTLPDLQRLYEVLLGHALYKKNFRDKIKDRVTETGGEGESLTGGRKSALYRYVNRISQEDWRKV